MFGKKKTGEEKFVQAVKDFIKYMEDKYTEDNMPNNLSWLFEHLIKGLQTKHFSCQILGIFEDVLDDEIQVRDKMKEILGEDRAEEILDVNYDFLFYPEKK